MLVTITVDTYGARAPTLDGMVKGLKQNIRPGTDQASQHQPLTGRFSGAPKGCSWTGMLYLRGNGHARCGWPFGNLTDATIL